MTSPAFLDTEFNLWQLGMRWKKDVNFMHDEKYIDLKEIVRNSCIVRVPQNNPRIKNQHGAFIIATANEAFIEEHDDIGHKITKYIIENKKNTTFKELVNDQKYRNLFSEKEPWHLFFRKVKPYSEDNKIDLFIKDPFNIRRLFYKKKSIQQVVLIPPECKNKIKKQIGRLNITNDYIYPDMENVAQEIKEKFLENEDSCNTPGKGL